MLSIFGRFAVTLYVLCLAITSYAQVPEYVEGEVIIKLKGSASSMRAQAFIGRAVSAKGLRMRNSWQHMNMHHMQLRLGQRVDDALRDLRNDPDVEYAEPNYILRRQSTTEYSNKVTMDQVHAAGVSAQGASAYAQITAPIFAQQAWSALTPGKAPVVVAIIDTGLDAGHEVFVKSNAVWRNPGEIAGNGLDDDGNGYIDDVAGWNFVANSNNPYDDDGHGTHVAGIILGTTQDITAATLQPSKVKIMPLKFLDSTGSGTTSDAIKAIYYAVNKGVKVMNNSWGGGGYSQSLLDAISFAYSHYAIFNAAAGNSATNNDVSPTYPANYGVPSVTSVAATTSSDNFASSFSNYGVTTVHLGSPGQSVWSTFPGNLYGTSSGTSMAAPFISGVSALALYEKPDMTGYQVKQLILNSADVIPSLSNRTITKARVNVYSAVMAAKGAAVTEQPSFTSSSHSSSSSQQAGGCGLVSKMISDDSDGSSSPGRLLGHFALLVALLAPIAISLYLRKRTGDSRRRFTRYKIDSQVRVMVGEKELVGNVSSISLGGVQLNTDAWLEKGGVVTMSIRSPDGKEEIKVDGQVVWSEEHKRYGVAFANPAENALTKISRWTQSLLKAS